MGVIGQTSFGGGINGYRPGADQYADGVNLVIRSGKAETRPGMRRYWRGQTAGNLPGIYFNQDGAKYNDAGHTGFWFDFTIVRQPWGGMQGVGKIRFPWETVETLLIVTEGHIYRAYSGYLEEVPSVVSMSASEVVEVIQAWDVIFILRGEGLPPLYWAGDAAGFDLVPDPDEADAMPACSTALFHPGGRLWTWRDQSDVYASAIIEFNAWDNVGRMFSIRPGDGDKITALHMFHEDTLLVFKQRSVTALAGINSIVNETGDPPETLADYVTLQVVDAERGLLARRAVVTVGEDVWYLGAGGIYSLSRNQQNKIQRQAVALSAPLQNYMARINWNAIEVAAAAIHDNYVLFSVPIDGSPRNNAMLVYDLLAPNESGAGAWVGVWTSRGRLFDVLSFFEIDNDLLFLDGRGIIRKMFCDVPDDASEPMDDTPTYDAGETYRTGDAVVYAGALFEALRPSVGVAPTVTTSWSEIADARHYYDIALSLTTRLMQLADDDGPMLMGKGEISVRHQRPLIDVDVFGESLTDAETLFEGITYSDLEHDTADTADWDPATDVDGAANTFRRDLALVVPAGGVLIGPAGLYAGRWKRHGLRFIRRLARDRGFGLQIRNTSGRVKIESIIITAEPRRFAVKE